jgi:hypothetical protein
LRVHSVRRWRFEQVTFQPVNKWLLERTVSTPYVDSMTEVWTGERVRETWTGAVAALRRCLPERFRGDRPVVPVVRLSGVIGFSTPLRPGLSMAGIARTLDRAFASSSTRRADRQRSRT